MVKRNRIPQVTDEQIDQMAALGVSAEETVDQVVAERSGADDKVMAVTAEGAKPKVPTYTVEGRAWIDADQFGLKTEGLYGQRGRLAVRPEDVQLRAQFLERPNDVADLEELHGPNTAAPATVDCTTCGQPITSFVRTAMIDGEGKLRHDKEGHVTYRGQFVVTGKPLAVHAAHVGDCLYKLRDARGKKKKLPNGRMVADLLPSQSFEQANARLAGIQGHFAEISSEKTAMQSRLGFKTSLGEVTRHNGGNRHGDDGIPRGASEPRLPRGESRKQRHDWGASE